MRNVRERNTALSILGLSAVLLALVFRLPYAFPVPHVIALSSVVGYNNRFAVILFACGSVLLSALMRNRLPSSDPADRPLPLRSLLAALLIVAICCAVRLLPMASHTAGSEAAYNVNRVQLLASGLRPYLAFEYAYGPAHLYVPLWLASVARQSVVGGYYLWWLIQWFLGAGMLWGAIKLIDLPLKRRELVFWVLFALQLVQIRDEGIAYTPARFMGTVFAVVMVVAVRGRYRNGSMMVAAAVLAVACGFLTAPEQGIALFSGFAFWFLLLVYDSAEAPLSRTNFAIFLTAGFFIATAAWRLGEFHTLFAFAAGGFSFPLLPSPSNIVVLTCYIAAGLLGTRTLLAGEFGAVSTPLFLVGYAMLPVSFGRCDLGHLMMASPALLLGIFALEGWGPVRRVWSPSVVALVLLPTFAIWLLVAFVQNRMRYPAEVQAENLTRVTHRTAGRCTQTYRTFVVSPRIDQTPAQACLATGYFYETLNALTSDGIHQIAGEVVQQPLQPLILLDKPLAEQFRSGETNVAVLHILEISPWVPQPRNPPLSYSELTDAVLRDYTPAAEAIGEFRVWYPKPSAPH